MKSISIDLETLSLSKHAAIISIGICLFDQTGILDSDHIRIIPKKAFGDISASTVAWWMEQTPAAQQQTFLSPEAVDPFRAAIRLTDFCNRNIGYEEVWANDPTFDLIVLQNWWQALPTQIQYDAGRFPFGYKQERSIRTIRAIQQEFQIEAPEWTGEAHNALDDAVNQARLVIATREGLAEMSLRADTASR